MDCTTQWHGIQAYRRSATCLPSVHLYLHHPAPAGHGRIIWICQSEVSACISWSFPTCYPCRVACSWHSRRQLNDVQGSKRLSYPPWQWDLPTSPPDIGHQSLDPSGRQSCQATWGGPGWTKTKGHMNVEKGERVLETCREVQTILIHASPDLFFTTLFLLLSSCGTIRLASTGQHINSTNPGLESHRGTALAGFEPVTICFRDCFKMRRELGGERVRWTVRGYLAVSSYSYAFSHFSRW